MSADIILFVPRSNPKADRAFWIGRELTPIEQMAYELMDQTVPNELSEYVAPQNDPA
jgi:hypothetical protein